MPSDAATTHSDWITDFLGYTDGLPTPYLFRLWAGITAVSGALERRVWAETARSVLFPNLFTLLVGPPASGKSQAIGPVGDLWYKTKKLKVSPDDMTKPSFLDALKEADRKMTISGGPGTVPEIIQFHSLVMSCPELGVLIPQHDLAFLSVLCHVYDNPATYREKRRSIAEEGDIINPQIVILAGSQPGFMGSLFPEEAWNMGFTSRMIMVYSGDIPKVDLFANTRPPAYVKAGLLTGLNAMTNLYGQCVWEVPAMDYIKAWHAADCPPVPEHSKLEHYRGRRILHVIKLSMISAVSRTGALTIGLPDVVRAIDWILDAERVMPDIFRQMAGKSDGQVLQELHFFAFTLYSAEKKPIHESRLIHFLTSKVPAEKIQKILEMADKSGMLVRSAGTQLFIPKPKNQHGLE